MVDDVTNKRMVAGFMFQGERRVLLVKKLKPSWQAGLLNGVGGVVEDSERPIDAMVREFREETGMATLPADWRHFCTEVEPFGAFVYFFVANLYGRDHAHAWPSTNDVGEDLRWVYADDVTAGRQVSVSNLRWLLPLAQDWRKFQQPVIVDVVGDIRERATW